MFQDTDHVVGCEHPAVGVAGRLAKQSDLFTDPIGHCKPPVSLLNVYCHYCVIYKQSPVAVRKPITASRSIAQVPTVLAA